MNFPARKKKTILDCNERDIFCYTLNPLLTKLLAWSIN